MVVALYPRWDWSLIYLLMTLSMPRLQNHVLKATAACSLSLETQACALGSADVCCVALPGPSAHFSAALAPTLHTLLILPPGLRTHGVPVYYQLSCLTRLGITFRGRDPSHVLLE